MCRHRRLLHLRRHRLSIHPSQCDNQKAVVPLTEVWDSRPSKREAVVSQSEHLLHLNRRARRLKGAGNPRLLNYRRGTSFEGPLHQEALSRVQK